MSFSAAQFTPNSTSPLGSTNFLGTGTYNILPDKDHSSMPESLPNTDGNIATIPVNLKEVFDQLPAAIAEMYNNDANALVKSSQFTGTAVDPRLYGNSQHLNAYWTAAQTLGTWLIHQIPGPQGPGSSASNPLDVPFTSTQKTNLIGNLSSFPDPLVLKTFYDTRFSQDANYNGGSWDPATSNTFFNLGYGNKAFEWDTETGNLTLSDLYVFSGLDDFGVSADFGTIDEGPINFLVGFFRAVAVAAVVGVGVATPIVIARMILKRIMDQMGMDIKDHDYPYNIHRGLPFNNTIGTVAAMHIKVTWTPAEIFAANPELFWHAWKEGYIPTSALEGIMANYLSPLSVGTASSPFLQPDYAASDGPIATNLSNMTFGGGGNYPQPFTSFSQRIVNASHSLGAYAKFGSYAGRIITITDSPYSGQLGFRMQPWDTFDDGNIIISGGHQLTKNEWFDSALKCKVAVRFLHLPTRPLVLVDVAYQGFSPTTTGSYFYNPNYGLAAAALGSTTLPLLIAAAGAATLLIL